MYQEFVHFINESIIPMIFRFDTTANIENICLKVYNLLEYIYIESK